MKTKEIERIKADVAYCEKHAARHEKAGRVILALNCREQAAYLKSLIQ